MEMYTFLRELADSWVLLAMTGFYLTAILWVFRPSAKKIHEEMSNLPLRDEAYPGEAAEKRRNKLEAK
jgi:cytochrome c oxidase cbb3-type subunit 4